LGKKEWENRTLKVLLEETKTERGNSWSMNEWNKETYCKRISIKRDRERQTDRKITKMLDFSCGILESSQNFKEKGKEKTRIAG
jgi:hypothetical protein